MEINKTIDKMFIILLVLVLIVSIPWHEGIKFCDSATYVLAAKKFVTTQTINYKNIFSNRVTVWLPYAVYIFFFGVNDLITWVASLEFCVLLCAVYFLLRSYDQMVAFYSVAFLGFSTLMIRESTETMGDIMLTLLMNLPVLIYWRYIKNENEPKALKFGVFAGICWVLAFYTKESAVYYLILFLCFSVAAYHKKLKHDMRFWYCFWLVLFLSGIATACFYYFETGDPFHKLWLVNKNITAHSLLSFERVWKTYGELIYRLTLQPVIFFTYDHSMGLMGLFAVVYLVHSRNSLNKFWRWYLIIPLIVWWVFPQKLIPYYPMWLTHRLWLPLLVPLAICAGHGMKIFVAREESKLDRALLIVTGISLIVISYISFGYDDHLNQKRVIFYGVVVLFIIIALYIHENEIQVTRKVITILILLFAFLVYDSGRFPEWRTATLLFIFLAFITHENKNLRKIALIVVLSPCLYYDLDRFFWTKQESDYKQVEELIEIVKKQDDPRLVLASSCFVEVTKLFDLGKMHFFSYEDARANNILNDVYLIIDKMLIDSKHKSMGADEQDYNNLPSIQHRIETHPVEMGFTLVQENERYQIYYK